MKNNSINAKHKDRLFSFVFGSEEHKEWALALYNAVNGTAYQDVEELEINTMRDVLYMGMKNDVSFIFQDTINLYEQQSSYNPNMPVRELMYAGKLYDKYIRSNKLNIYGSKQIRLPVPKCVVFYNGKEEKDDRILRLSDAFQESRGNGDIEVSVRMININSGHNTELMKNCKPLSEYAWLVYTIRVNANTMGIEKAVDAAMDAMPKDFVIYPFLAGHRTEVKNMSLLEYDENEVMELFKEEGRQEGKEEGRQEGKEEGRQEGREEGLFSSIQNVMQSLKVSASEAMDILKISSEERPKYMALL